MPGEAPETASDAGDFDVAALVEQLREELRRTGARGSGDGRHESARLDARAAADRVWAVSAERRAGAAGARGRPVKRVLRKLLRWYVEPALADQRAYNEALLRLVDDLYGELDRLRAEVDALRSR